jgi:hypothetical protein
MSDYGLRIRHEAVDGHQRGQCRKECEKPVERHAGRHQHHAAGGKLAGQPHKDVLPAGIGYLGGMLRGPAALGAIVRLGVACGFRHEGFRQDNVAGAGRFPAVPRGRLATARTLALSKRAPPANRRTRIVGRKCRPKGSCSGSELPAACLRDHEILEHAQARRVFDLFGEHEIGFEMRDLLIGQHDDDV